MNKKEYLNQIEKELNKYELANYYDLLYQARDVINQIDEDNIEEILGSPENYIKELFEINEIEPDLKAKKVVGSNAKMGIFASLLFITFGAVCLFSINVEDFVWVVHWVSFVALFFMVFGTFINVIKKQSSVYTLTLITTLFVMALYLGNTIPSVNATRIIVLLIFIFGCVNLFENIRARIFGHRKAKKPKSVFTETYSDHETLSVKMSFGAKNLHVTNNVKQLNVKSNFGETNINAEDITHDLVINLHGSFGQININLPKEANVIDNTSVSFGESKPTSRSGNGPVVTLNGKFSFGAIKY